MTVSTLETSPMQGPDAQEPPKRRSWLSVRSLSLIISAVLVVGGFLLAYNRFSAPDVVATLLRLDWTWFVAAIVCYWLQNPITAFRLERMLVWLQRGVRIPPFRLILKLSLSSGFIAAAAPIGLVADIAKIGALSVFGGLSSLDATRCILFDRVAAAQWMGIFGLMALPLQWALNVPLGLIAVQALVLLGVIGSVGVVLILRHVLAYFKNATIDKMALLFSNYSAILLPRRLLVQMIITAANLVLVWLTLYCLLRAAKLEPDLLLVACFTSFLQLINSVPFLYMGWGGREIAMAATLGTVSGLTLGESIVVSAAWGITLIVSGAVNGVFMLGEWVPHSDSPDRSAGAGE